MDLVRPDDAGYDEARALFNVMVDKRPALIVRCSSKDDVADALAYAQAHGLEVAVRAGGHSVSGLSSNDGGLVVDVRPMKTVVIDPDAMTARVGGGVTWGELDADAQDHGLAVTGGRATSTGVAGFTLGGGDGWLSRAYGLACDNLLAVDLVTADGREVRASESENPELFWALHGGGGNFGVATAFEFRMHRLGPTVLAGLAAWPVEAAGDIVRAYRDLAQDAPDALGGGIFVINTEDTEDIPAQLRGQPVVAIAVCYAGPVEEGESVIAPWRALQAPMDLVRPMPYTEFQIMLTDPPGFRHYWSADYHDDFPDPAVDVFVDYGLHRPNDLTQQVLFPWGGAVLAVPGGATPLRRGATRWITHPFAVWDDPALTDDCIRWARDFRRAIAPHTNGGVYLNFIGDEGQARVRAAYGEETYAKLAAIKAEWDPHNVFRGNQNIRPAG